MSTVGNDGEGQETRALPPPASEEHIAAIATDALIPLILHLQRVLPQILARSGKPHETLRQVLAGEMPAGEAVRTPEVMLAAYGRFRAMTLPAEQTGGATGEIPLADQAAFAFREAVFADQHKDAGTQMFPEAAAWLRTITADPSQARSVSKLPWRRMNRKQLFEAGEIVGHVTNEFGDYFLAEQVKVVHETDPYIHPLTLTRETLAVEAEDFARRHGGTHVAKLAGHIMEDVVGVEAVRENERGEAEVVHIRLLPTYKGAVEKLYDLTRQLQRTVVVPESLRPFPARPTQEVLEAFALDVLLTHPNFPASFRSTAYYLIRQQIPRLTERSAQS